MYKSGKRFGHELGLSCCFRQWKADSHCRYLHGYALAVSFEFETEELDVRNWVVDFGSLKSLKQLLEIQFDHTTLVAMDDPEYETFKLMEEKGLIQFRAVPATGCEAMAKLIYEVTEIWLKDNGYSPRVSLSKVTVAEHGANWASYENKPR